MQKGVVMGGPRELVVVDSLEEAVFSRHSRADAQGRHRPSMVTEWAQRPSAHQ